MPWVYFCLFTFAFCLIIGLALLPLPSIALIAGLGLALALLLLDPVFGLYWAVLSVPVQDLAHLPGGITYDATLEIARAIGLPVDVRPIMRKEALSADEMWLSSSTREVLAITKLDGAPFGGGTPGPVFRAVWQAFQERKPHPSDASAHALNR